MSADHFDDDLSIPEIPVVRAQLVKAAAHYGSRYAREFDWAVSCDLYLPQFESPLEAIFYVWWRALTATHDLFDLAPAPLALVLQRNVEIDGQRFRLDFVIEPTNPDLKKEFGLVAVEVDGHAFHERTPEQVAVRDSRDRLLQGAGWVVLHTSWRELTSNPLEIVSEVYQFAQTRRLDLPSVRAWREAHPSALRRKIKPVEA